MYVKDKEPLIAEEDIKCLKVVDKKDGKYSTFVRKRGIVENVVDGKEIRGEGEKVVSEMPTIYDVENVFEDLHYELGEGFVYSFDYNESGLYQTAVCMLNVLWKKKKRSTSVLHVWLCHIPKGSEYYEYHSEYASDKIIVDNDITDWFDRNLLKKRNLNNDWRESLEGFIGKEN